MVHPSLSITEKQLIPASRRRRSSDALMENHRAAAGHAKSYLPTYISLDLEGSRKVGVPT